MIDTTREHVENNQISEDESDAALLEQSKRMYREYILDHYANPRNQGRIVEADGEAHEENPTCGDDLTVTLATKNDTVTDIKFTGEGCAISIAAMSILSTQLIDEPVDTVQSWGTDDVLELLGLELTPTRVKCAILGLHAVKQALPSTGDAA